MGISITSHGNWDKTSSYLKRVQNVQIGSILNKYGEMGVRALSNATPVDSRKTADSWYYEVVIRKGYSSIRWKNHNMRSGIPIAILIQYGHGTKNGGYVQGQDYINPAIRPIFDQIAAEAWKEVTK